MSKNEASEKVSITEDDLDRFHRNAPAALARRGPAFAVEQTTSAAQTIFAGTLPIVGLFYWGWSANELLLFLMIGVWTAILSNTAKLFCLSKRAEAFAAASYDDWHVWVVADALRSSSNEAYSSHLRARWQPSAGVFVDFIMGGISTMLIVVMLVAEEGLGPQSFQTRGVWVGLAVMVGIRVVTTVWEIAHHRENDRKRNRQQSDPTSLENADRDRPVRVIVGLRGVGLFLLVFLTAILTDEDGPDVDAVWWMMLVVNSLIVLFGLVNFVGPLILRGETRWLRNYLASRDRAGND